MHLQSLYYYPVKSMAGIQTTAAEVVDRGLVDDRRWMLVDAEGRFITQRQLPRLALISVMPDAGGWRMQAPGQPDLALHEPGDDAPMLEVTVWRDRVQARLADRAAGAWLERFTGQAGVSLVYMPDASHRRVDPAYAGERDIVSFADGFPFLLISQASLDDLNARMETPLPMIRFRPNLVVDGCGPFAEDGWKRIRIGELNFRVAKPCSRCKVTTVDPWSGTTGREPLKTLAGYRRRDNEVWFGMNLIHEGTGVLRVGDEVEVIA